VTGDPPRIGGAPVAVFFFDVERLAALNRIVEPVVEIGAMKCRRNALRQHASQA
jgi:hypothetical protein